MPLQFDSAAHERRTRVLAPAALWLFIASAAFLFPLGLFQILGTRFLYLSGITCTVCIILMVLLRKGYSRTAGTLLIAVFLAAANLQPLQGMGIYDTIIMLNLLAIMMAGVLFGPRAVVGTAILATAFSGGVAYLTAQGNIAAQSDPMPYAEWFRRVNYFFVAVIIYWLGWQATRRALKESDEARSENRSLIRSLSNIMEQGNIGHWYLNVRTGEVFWSSNVPSIFGVKAEEFDGSLAGYLRMILDEDRELLRKSMDMAIKNPGSPYQVEHRIRTPDGEIRWLEGRGSVKFEDGAAVEMAGVVVDITEQKIAQSTLQRIYSILAEGIVVHNSEGVIVSYNHSALEILGLTEDQLLGKTSMDPQWRIVNSEGEPMTGEEHPSSVSMRTGEPQHGTILGVTTPENELRWIAVNSIPFSEDGSDRRGAVVSFFDVTQSRNQSRSLQKSEEQLRFILENQPSIVLLLDLDGKIHYVNAVTAGYDMGSVLGRDCRDFVPEEDRSRLTWAIDRIITERKPFTYDIRGYNANGEIAWYNTRIGILEYHEKERIIMISSDISERIEAEQKLRSMAYTDLLTGLPNREALYAHLTDILEKEQAEKKALLFVDLDHFKNINDTLGHDVGDRLLTRVARSFLDQISDHAFLARLGGDEFMMVYSVQEEDQAFAHAAEVLDLFREPINVDGHDLYLSASIGLCFYPGDGENMHQLIKNADAAMYKAKARGRNNYCRFEQVMETEIQTRLLMDTELRQAADKQELSLHYQPVFDLRTDEISGLEALMRWNNSQLGNVSPAQFIPLAEETGSIRDLDFWTMRSGIEQLAEWRKKGLFSGRLALNMSSRQLENNQFIPELQRLLSEASLSGFDISLELTETALMKNIQAMDPLLHSMGQLGIELMIDDFGTGYSSLNYLRRLPVHVVKIDRSFVEEIGSDESDSIIRTIIAMARTLELKVIAEGVETPEQLAFLKREGCHMAQGFFLARPEPANLVSERLSSHSRPKTAG
ncbi:MAG: EAL domain-containing protein [Leptospiraceae bacterium]